MCLDVDNEDWLVLADGERRARKEHACKECGRVIERGETYQYWTGIEYGEAPETHKMCAHCWETIDYGARLTGCPRAWWWEKVHDLDPDEGGFVGDIIANHDLTFADEMRLLRRCVQRKRKWRRHDGTLYPIASVWLPVNDAEVSR